MSAGCGSKQRSAVGYRIFNTDVRVLRLSITSGNRSWGWAFASSIHFSCRESFCSQLRGHTPGAWKKLKTWRRHELPRRAPPIPPAVVHGVAGLAWVQGRLDVAHGVLIGFHCMLRGSEVLGLKFCDCGHSCPRSGLHQVRITKRNPRTSHDHRQITRQSSSEFLPRLRLF